MQKNRNLVYLTSFTNDLIKTQNRITNRKSIPVGLVGELSICRLKGDKEGNVSICFLFSVKFDIYIADIFRDSDEKTVFLAGVCLF